MPTVRQIYGQRALEIVRRHCPCVSCLERKWKFVGGEQRGVDLQCIGCGRFAESKGQFLGTRLSLGVPNDIPGASYRVWLQQLFQGHNVDLYFTRWTNDGNFVVRGIRAELRPPEFMLPRAILTGPRAGYVLLKIRLSLLDPGIFPILAQHQEPAKRVRLLA